MTYRAAEMVGLNFEKTHVNIRTFAAETGAIIKQKVSLTLKPHFESDVRLRLTALIVQQLNTVPSCLLEMLTPLKRLFSLSLHFHSLCSHCILMLMKKRIIALNQSSNIHGQLNTYFNPSINQRKRHLIFQPSFHVVLLRTCNQ